MEALKGEEMLMQTIVDQETSFPPGTDPGLAHFLSRCLMKHPRDRAGPWELIKHPWVVHMGARGLELPALRTRRPYKIDFAREFSRSRRFTWKSVLRMISASRDLIIRSKFGRGCVLPPVQCNAAD